MKCVCVNCGMNGHPQRGCCGGSICNPTAYERQQREYFTDEMISFKVPERMLTWGSPPITTRIVEGDMYPDEVTTPTRTWEFDGQAQARKQAAEDKALMLKRLIAESEARKAKTEATIEKLKAKIAAKEAEEKKAKKAKLVRNNELAVEHVEASQASPQKVRSTNNAR